MTGWTAAQLAQQLQLNVLGDGAITINDGQPFEDAGSGHVTFLSSNTHLKELKNCRADAVVSSEELIAQSDVENQPACWIVAEDPAEAFLQILNLLRPRQLSTHVGISPEAAVSADAQIGDGSFVAPGAYVGPHVQIGSDCQVHPGVHIGPGCKLGDGVVLHPNVVLYDGVELGNRVTIHASAVIGADGFGYRVVDGRHQRLEHFGNVIIEDDVEIGACTTVDRGMIGETRIGRGTKIDNQVMIAHNCKLGAHNILVSQVGFAGSVTTGEFVVCAGQVGIGDHVHLGDHSVFGAKAGVHKDMPGHTTYLGTPAEPEGETIRTVMSLKKLPMMRRQLKTLEGQVAELARQLGETQDSTPHAA